MLAHSAESQITENEYLDAKQGAQLRRVISIKIAVNLAYQLMSRVR